MVINLKRPFSIFVIFLCALFLFIIFAPTKNDKKKEEPSNISSSLSSNNESPKIEQNNNSQDVKMRACWFSYIEWQSLLCSKSKDDYTNQVKSICDSLKNSGFNTIILHVRSFGDAMYPSKLFPMSKCVSGEVGSKLDYDPLNIFLEEAKTSNISVHCWINPLRTMTDKEFSLVPDEFLLKKWYTSSNKNDYYMKDTAGRHILIPSNPEVRKLICDGVKELLENYNVDGIHMDDYFYPTGVDNLEENDTPYYNKVNPGIDINQWRRSSTSTMVKELYKISHDIKSNIEFGISPQANIKNNYDKMFIEVEKWLSEPGYVDYIMPQIYFGFENTNCPFDKTAQIWDDMIKVDVKYYVGLAAYKIGLEDDVNAGKGIKEWSAVASNNKDMLKRQEQALRNCSKYKGYCLFTYQSIFDNDGNKKDTLANEIDNLNSLF